VPLGGLNPRTEVADSRAEQSPEGGAGIVSTALYRLCGRACSTARFVWRVRCWPTTRGHRRWRQRTATREEEGSEG
jgi:hypothetical protein